MTDSNDLELRQLNQEIEVEFLTQVIGHDIQLTKAVLDDNPNPCSYAKIAAIIIERLNDEYDIKYFLSLAIDELKKKYEEPQANAEA